MAKAKVGFRERFRISWLIFRQTMSMLGSHRDLWIFPLLGLLAMVPFFVGIVLFGLWLTSTDGSALADFMAGLGDAAPLWFAAAPFALLVVLFPFMVLASLFNAALVFAAYERLEGRPGLKMEAMQRAVGQIGPITRFNLIGLAVSILLAIVGQVVERLRIVPFLGAVIQNLGAFAWATAAYFVVPILVVERERSAVEAVRKSVGIARQQWGKSVAGMITIGLVFTIPMMLLAFLVMPAMMFGFMSSANPLVIGFLFGGVFFAIVLLFSLLAGTAQLLYQTALYRYATTGLVPLPYTPETMVDAWRPYQK